LQQISKRNEYEDFCIDFDVAPDGVLHEGRRGKGRHRAGGRQNTGGVLQPRGLFMYLNGCKEW